MIIWLDIETIPGDAYPDPSLLKAPANYKDPERIGQYKLEKAEEAWKKQALNSLQGQILCIGYAVDDEEPECLGAWGSSEEEIMKALNNAIDGLYCFRWGGFFIRNFDLQWLYHRAVKYGLSALINGIPRRYGTDIIDIYEDWAGTERSTEGYNLDNIARFLGLEGKSGSGQDVLPMYLSGQYEAVAGYCKNDVRLVREVARKIDKWF